MTLVRESHCKVNLILNILGKRPDGFHEVETLLYPLRLTDRLDFTHRGVGIQLSCSDPSLPTDANNLVFRAAAAFFETANLNEGIAIHLEKRLPIAAGIGGGSANAAATLLALNELFPGRLKSEQLYQLAATLGADVPFFLQSQPALGLGKGEQVEPLPSFAAMKGKYLILAHPGFGISTPWAYKELARFPNALNGERGRARRLIQNLTHGDLSIASPDIYNSLEAPALEKYPILVLYQQFFREAGAEVALMSGSGSSTFAIIPSEHSATNMVEQFRGRFGTAAWTGIAPL
jgi:4-diphosphocytidyl-2-C-methyl-D-erythritol kinase